MQGSYNPVLVILSIVIASAAAYTSFNLIAQLSEIISTKLSRVRTMISGSVMGLGIWSMHFVAMLAYEMPMTVRYDGPLTILSLVVAILACIIGLAVTGKARKLRQIIIGGSLIGCGISSMHYIGMGAMNMPARLEYETILVIASVSIGILAATASLWFAFSFARGKLSNTLQVKLFSSILMGLAISGMHYVAMAGTNMMPVLNVAMDATGFVLNPEVIGISLTISILLLMGIILWSAKIVAETEIIRANEEKINAITSNVIDAIITIDKHGIIISANPAVKNIFGYSQEQMIGESIRLIVPEPWKSKHDEYLNRYRRTGDRKMIGKGYTEMQAVKYDGNIIPVELAISEAKVSGESIYIGVIRDITDRVKTQERLNYLAHHDVLTSLPNRFSFSQHIEQAITHAQRLNSLVAVMFLDLDRFKVINDTLGHNVGDYLLQRFAERITDCVRPGDTIARISGDEFTVLLDDIEDVDEVAVIAERIVKSLTEPFNYLNRELFTSVSIGICLFPDTGENPQSLMKHADIAMYAAKDEGGGQFCFYTEEMNAKSNERLVLESDLHRALERGELFLNYQPQIDIDARKISCVEVLLRWKHPKLGLIPPCEFIPILEDTGQIVEVGDWVIKEACAQNKSWQEKGLEPFRIAINLSGRQFTKPGLATRIGEILSETGLAAECLELEITESILMQQTQTTVSVLKALHAMGIKIAIDDFGTGYSSLSYLKRFPIDVLKIDQSFVRDISIDQDDAEIVKLIVDMANSLNMGVVAEGVETQEQLDFLSNTNCHIIQGYLYSMPLSEDKLYEYCSAGLSSNFKASESA